MSWAFRPYFLFLLYIYIYDRNSNLNLYTRIFWGFRELNPRLNRGVRLFGEGNYYWAECLSDAITI